MNLRLYQTALACFVGLFCKLASADEINGRVLDSESKPISHARVDIATAAPKFGEGVFCPSCYSDCNKSAITDRDGRFRIQGLDPRLKFRLVATAANALSSATKPVDPSKESPTIVLHPIPSDLSALRKVKGHVTDENGAPVVAALIEVVGGRISGTGSHRRFNGEESVTDDEGSFQLVLSRDYDSVDVKVTAEGCAGTIASALAPGTGDQQITVPMGATVNGKLTFKGVPQPFQRIAVVQTDRLASGGFKKSIPTLSDSNGEFKFRWLPSEQIYAIFTPVDELSLHGVIKTSLFEVGKDGTVLELGEIAMMEPVRLRGSLKFDDGREPPVGIKLALDRLPAWDLIEVEPSKDGVFSIDGLPPETYVVRVLGTDIKLSTTTAQRFQALSRQSFAIRSDNSITDVEIVVTALDDRVDSISASSSLTGQGKQSLSGTVRDVEGAPVSGIRVFARARNGPHLPQYAMSGVDGKFVLTGLPEADVDVLYSDPKIKGYPLGKNGISVLFPGHHSARRNEENIKLLYDPRIYKRPPTITAKYTERVGE